MTLSHIFLGLFYPKLPGISYPRRTIHDFTLYCDQIHLMNQAENTAAGLKSRQGLRQNRKILRIGRPAVTWRACSHLAGLVIGRHADW
jgi:hypothetical protein